MNLGASRGTFSFITDKDSDHTSFYTSFKEEEINKVSVHTCSGLRLNYVQEKCENYIVRGL